MDNDEKKNIVSKLIKSRIKGKAITSDFQEEEVPQHIISCTAAAIETAILASILWMLLEHLSIDFFPFFIIFSISFLLLKLCLKSFLAWSTLQRLHTTIEQERWQIEHRRPEEKAEIETLYKAKGFKGKLLEDVVNTLMSDDNRLLQIMIEEEMGIALGSYEHPLKQGLGSAVGVFIASIIIMICYFLPSYFIYIAVFLIIFFSAYISSLYQKTKTSSAIIWNLAIAALIIAIAHFIPHIFT